jgi:hypothetical protein
MIELSNHIAAFSDHVELEHFLGAPQGRVPSRYSPVLPRLCAINNGKIQLVEYYDRSRPSVGPTTVNQDLWTWPASPYL